jgi:hypothetical protein
MKHLHAAPTTLALSTLSLVAGLAGCYVAEPGVNGQLAFVPSECGQLVCDFDDRLAVGATVEVEVQAADGRDVEGIELISGDSAVFEVIARDEFDLSRFTLRGTGAGTADLIGIDGAGHEIDFAPITIALATDVQLDVLGGDVQGPTAADPLTDEYQLAAGTAITITARPADAGGALMGVTPVRRLHRRGHRRRARRQRPPRSRQRQLRRAGRRPRADVRRARRRRADRAADGRVAPPAMACRGRPASAARPGARAGRVRRRRAR